jgi:hypothetical protein
MKKFYTCRRAAFNTYHRHLSGMRSMNLVDGSASHTGIAAGMATRNWTQAKEKARECFEANVKESNLLPEEDYLKEQHWKVVDRIIDVYREGFEKEVYQVIQPECEFLVEIPGTEHNDITMHWRDIDDNEHWDCPTAEDIIRGVRPAHYGITSVNCKCYQPHRLTGKTDAIVYWNGNIWLLEHKTTALSGQQFWSQWQLDIQPTAYIYGIWRSGLPRPRGFVLNALIKPSEGQVAGWNNRRKDPSTAKNISDYIKYEREAFFRSEEDLTRVEQTIIAVADDWESSILKGYQKGFYMSPVPGACVAYNRLCDFHGACLSHDSEDALAAVGKRERDYVDEARTKLVQIG